jgi:diguanylate cyclase (GGDEF)-like protein
MAKMLRPDLILLDVEMPHLNGYDACELLGVQAETANIPIIFLSASASPADRARGLNMGAADFMAKPFFGDELRARIRVSMKHKFLLEVEAKRATRDWLTGLWNRAHFEERLAIEAAAAMRHKHALSCIMLDIDHFKSVNDTHGHVFGDTVICAVAHAIQQAARREDGVFRYGGEEFAILCPCVPVEGATHLAERIRVNVAQRTLPTAAEPISVTISLGLADERNGIGGDLVRAADAALYLAKRSGRNRVCNALSFSNVEADAAAAISRVA